MIIHQFYFPSEQNYKSSEFWKFNNLLLSHNISKGEIKQQIQNIMDFPMIPKSNENSLNIKFTGLQ